MPDSQACEAKKQTRTGIEVDPQYAHVSTIWYPALKPSTVGEYINLSTILDIDMLSIPFKMKSPLCDSAECHTVKTPDISPPFVR